MCIFISRENSENHRKQKIIQYMALSAEHILTLQQLKGVGTKTIFKVAEQVINPISSIEELCAFWNTLKGKKLEAIGVDEIVEANNSAKRIIAASANASIGLVGYYDDWIVEAYKNLK